MARRPGAGAAQGRRRSPRRGGPGRPRGGQLRRYARRGEPACRLAQPPPDRRPLPALWTTLHGPGRGVPALPCRRTEPGDHSHSRARPPRTQGLAMSIRLNCRACRTAFVTAEEHVGRTVACPKCGTRQKVSATVPVAEPASEPPPPRLREPLAAPEPKPRPAPRHRRSRPMSRCSSRRPRRSGAGHSPARCLVCS